MTIPFAHLHIHSHYSPLDGIMLVDKLLGRAKELGQTAMALTDHGVMYGAVDFYTTAKKMGMKPLVGFEAYVAPGNRQEKNQSDQFNYNHLTLMARNFEGYQNLSRLCSEGFLTGFYRYPRIDKAILRDYSGGVCALSGCLRGEIPQMLLSGRFDEAEKAALWYQDLFGKGNYFLEIMNNGLEDQQKILPAFRELSNKTGIPLVATADSHFLLPEHIAIQDIMICINTGRLLSESERMHGEKGCHLKSVDEMLAALPGFEDAIANTMQVVDVCNVELPLKGFHLPTLEIPDGMTAVDYMSKICIEGLHERYGDPLPQAVVERFEKERGVIEKMGFPDYFLIVWDVVNFARTNGIPVGPGRGSAAGSIVAYGLGITNIDPLKYGLFFERFLNEGRNEMPDIDLDFDKERRQEVVSHIINRHGADHCAKIITFGCLSLKSGIRDVGRVMEIPLSRTDQLAKMIPDMFKAPKGMSPLEGALKTIPELKKEYDSDPQTKTLLDAVGELEGVMRNTGVHAAGVLVADSNITDYGPLAARSGEVTTQYEMKALEKFGLCKIDVLGLETLSLIKNAVEAIRKNQGVEVDIDALPLDDKPTFDMLSRGDSKGVFQFESDGFRQLLTRLQPTVFEDLIAAVAIYRPGPLQFVDGIMDCKHGRTPIKYPHPLMEPILSETYGFILYQEQVQALAQNLAGFNLSEGDLMRRAMGKKDEKLMEQYRQKFVDQAGPVIGTNVASTVYEQIFKFAGYGFNKSHSACYALIAYQTAWLKCHYPREYMAAVLTINRGDSDKIVLYSKNAAENGIKVLPICVNSSDAFFAVDGGNIHTGLASAKGIGDSAALAIEEERRANGPFKDLFDLTARVDFKSFNKGALEALIKAGAMDCFGERRASMVAGLEQAINAGVTEQKSKASGQLGLFAGMMDAAPPPSLPKVPEWEPRQLLEFEKAVLGYYSSSHPLAEHAARLEAFATAGIIDLKGFPDSSQVVVGGLITKVILKNDKKDRRMALLEMEDMAGTIRAVVFASTFESVKDLLVVDSVIFVDARLDLRNGEPSLVVNSIIPLDKAEEELAVNAVLQLDMDKVEEEKLELLRELISRNRGKTPLFFRLVSLTGRVDMRADDSYTLKPCPEVVDSIREWFGPGVFTLGGRRRA